MVFGYQFNARHYASTLVAVSFISAPCYRPGMQWPEYSVQIVFWSVCLWQLRLLIIWWFVDLKVRRGEYDAALRRLHRFAWMTPRVHRLHHRGLILVLSGRDAEAIPLYCEAIDLARAGFRCPIERLYSCLGHAMTSVGRYEEAAGWLQQAIVVGDKTGNAHNGLAQCYLRSGDNAAKALGYAEQAIEIARKRKLARVCPIYYADHAHALAMVGKVSEARETLARALPSPRENVASRAALEWNCGKALQALGQVAEARERFQAGATLDPRGKYGRYCLQDLHA
jgi:tetratricopeptide (TPR) repeat protein